MAGQAVPALDAGLPAWLVGKGASSAKHKGSACPRRLTGEWSIN
jgi:hypothetical protein